MGKLQRVGRPSGCRRAATKDTIRVRVRLLVETTARPSVVALPLARAVVPPVPRAGRSITRRRGRGQPFPGPRRTIESLGLRDSTKHKMFKRMVTMRKALHKREEDTTPRGVEADELVEELGRERSKALK